MQLVLDFSKKMKFIFVFLFLLSISGSGFAQEKLKTYYVCDPCECEDDGKISHSDGECPSCLMPLTKKMAVEIPDTKIFKPITPPSKVINVAVFLFAFNQVLDYAGPYDVFASAGSSFNVYTVGATSEPITTYPKLVVTPNYNINNAPKPNIIIVPAGAKNTVNKEAREWLLKSAENADYVLSICNGAFLIAELGL